MVFYIRLMQAVILLYVIYILTVFLQILDVIKITNREIKTKYAFIPFYYWINVNNKNKKSKKK